MYKYAFVILASLTLSSYAYAEGAAKVSEAVEQEQKTEEAKGYLVIEHGVPTPELMEALEEYIPVTRALLDKYEGRFIIGESENLEYLEGDWKPPYFIVIEFPSYENVRKFYYSEDYQRVLPLRQEIFKDAKSILVKGRAPAK